MTVERRAGKIKPEVRTVADSIHLTGIRFGRTILRPDQLEILKSEYPFVYISGPPGSGKTLILGVKATIWAIAGYQVVIIRSHGVNWGSLVSWTLYEQVIEAVQNTKAKILSKRRKKPTAQSSALESSNSEPSKQPVAGADKVQSDVTKPKKKKKKKNNKTGHVVSLESHSSDCALSGAEAEIGGKLVPCSAVSTGDLDLEVLSKVLSEAEVTNVHCEYISPDTDSLQFVDSLVDKYPGKGLRIIVDEAPITVTPARLHSQLSGSNLRLVAVQKDLRSFLQECSCDSEVSEDVECKIKSSKVCLLKSLRLVK